MKSRMISGFIIFFIVYSVFVYYIGWNGWIWLESAGLPLPPVLIYSLIVFMLAFSYLLGRTKFRMPVFTIIGSYWFGFLQYALLLLPLADLGGFILIESGTDPDKVIFWTGLLVILAFTAIFAYGTFNAYSPVVRHYSITIPKQAGSRKSLKIAMASDMHFGHLSGLAHLRRLVQKTNELQPDIILLPGDIIEDDPEPFIRKKMGDVMKGLSAPFGVYGVLGNHEYYGGAIPEFVREMNRIGIDILQDEVVEIDDSFFLAGRKDRTDKLRERMNDLLAFADPSMPIIMMDHQPAEVTAAAQHGVDLLLSGHTHRGQMAPNHLITRKLFEIDWGYLQEEATHVIVSSGYGFWGPPLRLGSRSEIVEIDVTFADVAEPHYNQNEGAIL
ncbi:metallophosphoesterase [Neobacillus notoginsengisoli]|uniref:Metallophosphoesterase n=1 Tax=Neobacillus notoginsengisoli TaxID=1578198 RepID=A0A417YWD2_9BACI|nr:metallophosphoesterase [Neobacillus notoginsengisoli]RHW41729.1 metallophosphoesterase [Neobacillus notoginsengisoli]